MIWLRYTDPIEHFPYFGVSKNTRIFINEDGEMFRAFLIEYSLHDGDIKAYKVQVLKRTNDSRDYLFGTIPFANKGKALKEFHEHFTMK